MYFNCDSKYRVTKIAMVRDVSVLDNNLIKLPVAPVARVTKPLFFVKRIFVSRQRQYYLYNRVIRKPSRVLRREQRSVTREGKERNARVDDPNLPPSAGLAFAIGPRSGGTLVGARAHRGPRRRSDSPKLAAVRRADRSRRCAANGAEGEWVELLFVRPSPGEKLCSVSRSVAYDAGEKRVERANREERPDG